MSEWKDCLLGDVLTFHRGYDLPHAKMIPGPYPVMGSNGIIGWHNEYTTEAPGLSIGRSGSVGVPHLLKCPSWSHNTSLFVKDFKGNDAIFLYYFLFTLRLNEYGGGSAVPTLNRNVLHELKVKIPDLPTQRRIAAVLGALDDKIENNRKICENLEAQAQALFKSWFVDFEPWGGKMPEGWKKVSLSEIASYLNGLAMQKYRPTNEDEFLPVLKIKELRQGFCDESSEKCSSTIDSRYIVRDGDVIFSWSGSLLVDFWTGGEAGLNQHLFKVTSTEFERWYYYAWTQHHLAAFVKIAADKATTMGHITREHLEDAKVLVPDGKALKEMGGKMTPLYDSVVAKRLESRALAEMRDALLPKLMSGRLRVDATACQGEIDVEKVEI